MKDQLEEITTTESLTHSIEKKPLVTILVPFFNEELILEETVHILLRTIQMHSTYYDFEILLVNDGSTDKSLEIAAILDEKNPTIQLVSHNTNQGLGKALRTGFSRSKGDFVIVLDADLSYSPDHIEDILTKLVDTDANIVIASPYMEGGKISNVPWIRFTLSKWANRFLAFVSGCPVKTLTGMVRGYKGDFIRNLSLQSTGSEINPEILYKESIIDNKIEEIPAHLSWIGHSVKSRSKLKIMRHTSRTFLMGFLIKPFLFFIFPGLFVALFALYTSTWMIIHFYHEYVVQNNMTIIDNLTEAFREAYDKHPHTFIMAFLSSMLSVQLLSAGLQSLQSRYYFEELFSLQTKAHRFYRKNIE